MGHCVKTLLTWAAIVLGLTSAVLWARASFVSVRPGPESILALDEVDVSATAKLQTW
jgi:hypothetical protein